jgi:hypothetical protein
MRSVSAVALAIALLSLAACGGGEGEGGEGGPTMQPGSNCMSCHTGGEAGRFTAAGTVYAGGNSSVGVAGAVVKIVPSTGTTVTLTTNSVGNFYTSATLNPPLQISVSFGGNTNAMSSGASSGACGSCHKPAGNAAPRVHVGKCSTCH